MNNINFNTINGTFTDLMHLATPYLNQTKETVVPFINQAGQFISPLKTAAAPYMNSLGKIASQVLNATTVGSVISAKVSGYVSTHHFGSIYCATVAGEAVLRGSVNLLRSPVFLNKPYFKAALIDFTFAVAFGVGAINPIAGATVPVLSAIAGNAFGKQFSPTSRYMSAVVVQKIPEKMLSLIAKITSTVAFIVGKIANTAISIASSEKVHNIALGTLPGIVSLALIV